MPETLKKTVPTFVRALRSKTLFLEHPSAKVKLKKRGGCHLTKNSAHWLARALYDGKYRIYTDSALVMALVMALETVFWITG